MNPDLMKALGELKPGQFLALPPLSVSEFDAALLRRALEVQPEQSLMHYMKVERFRSLLNSRALYMRRLDTFEGDSHEGRFPTANSSRCSSLTEGLAEQLSLPPEFLQKHRNFIEGSLRQLTYIHCWFGWEREDCKMWDEYGDHGHGVCIRTTACRLIKAIAPIDDFALNLLGVTYSDDEKPIPEVISFLAGCRKRPQFKHEREIRLIGQLGEKTWEESCGENGLRTNQFRMAPVNLECLIESVYAGPNVTDGVLEELHALTHEAVGGSVVRRSGIKM